MVTHPGQTITNKNIGKLFSSTYFKSDTVRNTVKRFKECGIEPHNPLVFNEHDFSAARNTDHDVVGAETDNDSANLQTLVLENQHINLPEESQFMANVLIPMHQRSMLVFLSSNNCLKQLNVKKKEKSNKLSSSIYTSIPIKEI
ncbi:hypothetical protein TNCV_4992631 [Trichonephila clavipes]|nr:hypothetical protein TNCV_4992631 [Trichonephila clavipes]